MNTEKYVIKIGSNLLVDEGKKVAVDTLERLAGEIDFLRRGGISCLAVSSGAIGVGRIMRRLRSDGVTMPQKQALAAVGQPELMSRYREVFSRRGIDVAQVLLTNEDFRSRGRFMNIRNTLLTLVLWGVVPVINENDTVAVEEIKFGDNDILSAHVAAAVGADTLVILTDVEGLYRGAFAPENLVGNVDEITPEIEKLARRSSGSGYGTGGMASKIKAAKIASAAGVRTILARPSEGLFAAIKSGCVRGTVFAPRRPGRAGAKKSWLASGAGTKGVIVVDEGAAAAIFAGKSLLPAGVAAIRGDFRRGDTVELCDSAASRPLARGIVNFSSAQLAAVRGKHSREVAAITGCSSAEVVHRDNLVLVGRGGPAR